MIINRLETSSTSTLRSSGIEALGITNRGNLLFCGIFKWVCDEKINWKN